MGVMKTAAFCVVLSATLLSGATTSFAEASAKPENAKAANAEQIKRLPGGAVLRLAPETRIEMLPPTRLQLGPSSGGKTLTQVVKLISGRLDVTIPESSGKTPANAVLIQGPRKASGIAKGGHSVAISDGKRTTFAAIKGEMVAASGNDWRVMASGLARSFVGADPTPQERALPAAPKVELGQALALGLPGTETGTRVQIKAASRVNKYALTVSSVDGGKREVVRSIEGESPTHELTGLSPGQYEVTARVFDEFSINSPDSEPVVLRIVGAELPEGARFVDGAILMRATSRLRLIGAQGLEATYDGSTHFVTAPQTVGLARGQATLVRLREPGKTKELKIALEPNITKANVEIGPRSARWPKDKVSVTVKLFDNRGRALDDTAKVDASVRVNIRDARVNWYRAGNELRAVIPTPLEPGPWVVRVDVNDAFGDPITHSFLEVASSGN
jgi:hypothetical protein